MNSDDLNLLATQVLDAAFVVHREVGPGLLESTYQACMLYELRKRGHMVRTEVPVPVTYDGQRLVDVGYRMDMLVDSALVLEIKGQSAIGPNERAQLLSYPKHADLRIGLLLNFHAALLRDGIMRMVNKL